MSSPYKQVLVVGATSGIGLAMANRLIREGSKVIAVGRRQDLLDAFVQQHGKDKADSVNFDLANLEAIQSFVHETKTKYPDIDCVLLNAGVQSRVNLAEPAHIDLAQFSRELSVNYLSFVHLTVEFLPFLQNKPTATIMYMGSNISIIPAVTLSGYCASKAALNVFTLCLRNELAHANSRVKVVEISPPVVQTEIHDYIGEAGRQMGMPVDKFVDVAWKGIIEGKDQIVIGEVGENVKFNRIIDERREVFEGLAKIMYSH